MTPATRHAVLALMLLGALLSGLPLSFAQSTGSAASRPTFADAQRVLQRRIEEQSQRRIILASFRATDGPIPAPWDADGERRFLVTYEAEIEFVQPCLWDSQFEGEPVTFKVLSPNQAAPVPNRIFPVRAKGERFVLRGQLALKWSGSAWEPTGLTLSDPPESTSVLNNPVPAIKAVLPPGWAILKVEDGTYPSYRPKGSGKAIFLGIAGKQYLKEPFSAALYIMPADYQDSGEDPTHGKAASSPARLIATTKTARLYLWPGLQAEDWKTLQQDLSKVLLGSSVLGSPTYENQSLHFRTNQTSSEAPHR